MAFFLRRSSRSGAASPWFYAMMAIGFVGLAVWGVVQGDWLVVVIAVAMVVVVAAGAVVMRRMHRQTAEAEKQERDRHGRGQV